MSFKKISFISFDKDGKRTISGDANLKKSEETLTMDLARAIAKPSKGCFTAVYTNDGQGFLVGGKDG